MARRAGTADQAMAAHGISGDYGSRGNAYNAYLKRPPEERPATVTYSSGEQVVTEVVPDDVRALPQVQFIPGSASCNRAASAMVEQTGTTPVGGSGGQSTHIQTLLRTDEETWINPATGQPETHTVTKNGQQVTVTERAAKSTEQLGADRVAQLAESRDTATAYLDAELEAGRAVMVGMTYTTRDGNSDKTTDHWVTVYARRGDEYVFYDPATNAGAPGTFSPDANSGGVLETGEGRRYSVSQVMFNTASSQSPSAVNPDETWSQVATSTNANMVQGTGMESTLNWSQP